MRLADRRVLVAEDGRNSKCPGGELFFDILIRVCELVRLQTPYRFVKHQDIFVVRLDSVECVRQVRDERQA